MSQFEASSRKQFVKGASLARAGGFYVPLRLRSSAAQRFRERQLAAWREATGLVDPGVVPIAINGVEYADELAARRALKAPAPAERMAA